jgi:ADP-heptose:LPS heptosyltransferase
MATRRVRTAVFRAIGRFTTPSAIPAEPQRLILIKPDHFGDVLLISPALEALRLRFPASRITLAVSPRGEAAARHLPGADQVIVLPFPGLDPARQPSIAARWALLLRVARQWHGRYDAAVLLRDDFYWGAMLMAAARIPLRAGTASHLCAPFLTHAAPPARRPVTATHLRVIAALTGIDAGPDYWTPERPLRFTGQDASSDARKRRIETGFGPTESYVLLHPGAGAPIKWWTAERWATVVTSLRSRLGLRTLVVAGAGEQELIRPIVRHAGGAAVDFRAIPDIDLLAALMRGANLVLGVDSGPLHLAAALNVASVRLYGPIDPLIYGPWGDPRRHRWVASDLLCAPCDRLHWDRLDLPWHPCVRRLDPERVVEAAISALRT